MRFLAHCFVAVGEPRLCRENLHRKACLPDYGTVTRHSPEGHMASDGGSSLWRWRCSVWDCNRKTEAVGRKCWVVSSDGGLAPAPPGFSALVPVPLRGITQDVKRDAVASPLDRSRPLSRRSGCFPAGPYPPLSSLLIITAPGAGDALPGGAWSMAFYLGGKDPR